MWEASVTRSGGFYLNYVDAASGRGLPDEVFATAVTAGNELIAERIRDGDTTRLRELEGLIVYTYLSLMGLYEEARAALR